MKLTSSSLLSQIQHVQPVNQRHCSVGNTAFLKIRPISFINNLLQNLTELMSLLTILHLLFKLENRILIIIVLISKIVEIEILAEIDKVHRQIMICVHINNSV